MSDSTVQPDLHKVTVSFISKAWDALGRAAERRGLSKTDTINRAVQLYDFFEQEVADGAEVLLRYPSGEVSSVKFLDLQ